MLEQAATVFQLPEHNPPPGRRAPRSHRPRRHTGKGGRLLARDAAALGLAQALINSPRLLILDEPTSALDPMGRRAVLELITELQGKTTVFFSTHLLPDVERVCDDVAILSGGRVAATG